VKDESESSKAPGDWFKKMKAGGVFPHVIDEGDGTLFGEIFRSLYAKEGKVVRVFTNGGFRFRGRITNLVWSSLTIQPVGILSWLTRAKPINVRFKEIVAFK